MTKPSAVAETKPKCIEEPNPTVAEAGATGTRSEAPWVQWARRFSSNAMQVPYRCKIEGCTFVGSGFQQVRYQHVRQAHPTLDLNGKHYGQIAEQLRPHITCAVCVKPVPHHHKQIEDHLRSHSYSVETYYKKFLDKGKHPQSKEASEKVESTGMEAGLIKGSSAPIENNMSRVGANALKEKHTWKHLAKQTQVSCQICSKLIKDTDFEDHMKMHRSQSGGTQAKIDDDCPPAEAGVIGSTSSPAAVPIHKSIQNIGHSKQGRVKCQVCLVNVAAIDFDTHLQTHRKRRAKPDQGKGFVGPNEQTTRPGPKIPKGSILEPSKGAGTSTKKLLPMDSEVGKSSKNLQAIDGRHNTDVLKDKRLWHVSEERRVQELASEWRDQCTFECKICPKGNKQLIV